MMSQLQYLVDSIPNNPDTALILADKLEEEGDPRSELVRLSYNLRVMAKATPQRWAMEERLRSLLASGVRPFVPTHTDSMGIEFAFIPPGIFLMGSDRNDSEKPIHRVSLTNGFFMSKTPVTQAQWKKVMGTNPSYFLGDNDPVHCVSWFDCQDFCRKLRERNRIAVRLPTEAEWEFACRAGTTTEYYSGNAESALEEAGWCCRNVPDDNENYGTQAVGQKAPNAWGLYDMHGNVYEWCHDGWAHYRKGYVKDPKWEGKAKRRILRGGSWGSDPQDCRSAARYKYWPEGSNFGIGFRICFDLGN